MWKPFLVLPSLLALTAAVSAAPTEMSPDSVRQRIHAWQPTARERRWEQIGWARDIRDAERIAHTANRPVFLFTHDGRLNVGRC